METSTGLIHARAPIGIEGLLMTKWILESQRDVVADFIEGQKQFVHEAMYPWQKSYADRKKNERFAF